MVSLSSSSFEREQRSAKACLTFSQAFDEVKQNACVVEAAEAKHSKIERVFQKRPVEWQLTHSRQIIFFA